MKTLHEIAASVWFKLQHGSATIRYRLDERDTNELMKAIEANGWVIMPRELTAEMIEAAYRVQGTGSCVTAFYSALIEARPRHDDIGKPAKQGFGEGGFGT